MLEETFNAGPLLNLGTLLNTGICVAIGEVVTISTLDKNICIIDQCPHKILATMINTVATTLT